MLKEKRPIRRFRAGHAVLGIKATAATKRQQQPAAPSIRLRGLINKTVVGKLATKFFSLQILYLFFFSLSFLYLFVTIYCFFFYIVRENDIFTMPAPPSLPLLL